MMGPKFILRSLAFLVMALWAQNAAALSCGGASGSLGGNLAAELFANANEGTCGSTTFAVGPTKDGHIFIADEFGVTVQFINNGNVFAPASKSLSCIGSTGTSVFSTVIRANFPSTLYSTSCTLTYTDANSMTVTHGFGARTSSSFGFIVGTLNASTVTSGWFERIPPTITTLSGLAGTIGDTPQWVTIGFSEPVYGFDPTNLNVVNALITGYTVVSTSEYQVELTRVGTGSVSINVPAGAAADIAGNLNLASATLTATVDVAAPTVTISGLPASIASPVTFDATIIFSEVVTGFAVGDINISGGLVTAFSGSGATYTATVSANGTGDLVMSVSANVAQDAALNGNVASATVTAPNVVAEQTNAVISKFLLTRANALLSNQPDLAGLLRGGAGQFEAEVTRGGGTVAFDSGYNAPLWARLNANWSTDLGAESQYIFGVIGGHSKLSENLLLGGMLQFDTLSETNGPATTQGTGWLLGPYFVAKLPSQPLYFEGSLLYGQTANTVSPLGTYTDAFTTERWLATLGISGELEHGQLTLLPFLDAKYTSDTQAAYIDGLGNPIAAQTIGLAQVSAGLDFELALSAATDLNGGISAVWSGSSGSVVTPGYEGARAKLAFGVSHRFSNCNTLGIAAFYDGIGTPDFESFGADLKWQTCF